MCVEFSKYTLTAPKHQSIDGTNLSVVDHWIGRCSRNHTRCAENGELWYPSRLLRLSSSRVKLIISKDSPPKGSYITLSHRWAAQPYTKLKPSTMKQLQHGIDVASLPQIFQDTITIARHLCIKHLWIDALCIIQDEDNNSDWEKESQNMDKIYSCAFLNVSATMSIDGFESLFRKRSWGLLLPSEIELEVNGLNQKYYVLDGDIWYDDIIDAPLNKKGWVFQERFLARRVLHFGQRQMGWECQELDALEMFPEGLVPAWAISSSSKSKFVSMITNLTQQSDETPPDLDFVNLWQDLVTEYSKCKLTYSKDKLIAFLGVAKRMMRARPDHYAAGMWEKGMVYDLAWWRLSEDREAFPISDTSWRAPSWSWASADGEIDFPSTFAVQQHFIHILDLSELIRNPCSAISPTASIRIKGHCLPLSLEWSNEEIVGFKVAESRFPVGRGARDSTINLELPEEELLLMAQRRRVLLLPLFATSYFLYAIVITKIRGVGAHRRLGAVQVPIGEETNEEDHQYSRLGEPQAYAWVRQQSAGRLDYTSKFWSVAGIKLGHYLLNPGRVYRTIDLY